MSPLWKEAVVGRHEIQRAKFGHKQPHESRLETFKEYPLMRQIVSILCLLGFPALCLSDPVPFDWANKTGDGPDTNLSWGVERDGFSLSSDGLLSPNVASRPKLKLPLDKGAWIELLQVQRYGKDLLLAFQTDNGEEGRGYICRISWPNNAIQWCRDIPGFNIHVSSGMDSVYIGAIGFMGRLDPSNGRYIWQNEGLYEKDHSLNILCLTKEGETTVEFNASSGGKGAKSEIEQISLDRQTGKIIHKSFVGTGFICRK